MSEEVRGDPGEIQGRSIDLRGSVFRGVGGSIGKGIRWEGVGAEGEVMRIRAKGGLGRWGRGRDKDDGEWRGPRECGEE